MMKIINLLWDRIYKMKERRTIRSKIAQREFEKDCENINNTLKAFAKAGESSNKE